MEQTFFIVIRLCSLGTSLESKLHAIQNDKRWVHAASLVVRKGATLESSFPPLPVHGDDGPGPSVPHPG